MWNLLVYSLNFSSILISNRNFHRINGIAIILPGMNVPAEEYIDLGRALQTAGNKKHIYNDIIIANVSSTSKYAYHDALYDIEQYIKQQYTPTTPRFLIGHSIGALFGIELAETCCQLLVQLGQVFATQNKIGITNAKTMEDYTKPVLTILGKKDVFIDYTDGYNDLESTLLLPTKMLIVIPELTHMQMAGGNVMESAKKKGIVEPKSSMNLKTAHRIISKFVTEFIDAVYYDSGFNAMRNLHTARVETWRFY